MIAAKDLVVPGYYWWLPLCAENEATQTESWSIISWHPMNNNRQKSGWFVGPLQPPIRFGCHCDLEEGMKPDGCVIDEGALHKCVYAKPGMIKEQCEYWKPINDGECTVIVN